MRYYLVLVLLLLINLTSFSQAKIFNVGFLVDKSNSEIEALLNELEKEIKAVVGEDAILQFSKNNRLINNFDVNLALKNYNQLLANETDIIIAFGVVNNIMLINQEHYIKPTILFGTFSEELLGKSSFKNLEKAENFTPIVTLQSYEEDLSLLKQLVAPKRVGVILEESLLNYKSLNDIFDGIANRLELELEFIPFNTLSDIMAGINDYDAVYLVGGFYLSDEEIRTLAEFLIEKKIPSFTTTPVDDVKNGLLATNHDQSEITQFFRRIALSVESIVTEDEFDDLPSVLEFKKTLTINYNTSNRLGLSLKYSLIASTNFVADSTRFAAEKKYTLVEVMKEAIAENLRLKTFRQDVQIAEQDTKLAKSDYLPDVFVSASGAYIDPKLAEVSNGQNPELSTAGNITLNQTIFSNTANANISIQKALQQAQQENYNSEALNTVFNVSTAYFNALILKANYQIQSQNLELTQQNLQIATQNFEAGQSGKVDVLRFRSELTKNIQVKVEAINELKQGFYNLNQLLNNPIDTKIDVEEAELKEGLFSNYNYKQLGTFLDDPILRKPFVQFLIQEAMANAPELKSLDYNLMAAERSERLFSSGRFLPTIALRGQYNYTFSRSGAGSTIPPIFQLPPDGYYNIGLSVSLPLFNQNKQNLNEQIASIQMEQLNTTIDDLRLTIEKNINDAVLQLINQITNIELSRVFEETAEEALDLTQTAYASGAVNIVQLLDAQNNFLQAQLASSNATYNYLLSSMRLERYLGNFFLLQTEDERAEFIRRFLEYINNN